MRHVSSYLPINYDTYPLDSTYRDAFTTNLNPTYTTSIYYIYTFFFRDHATELATTIEDMPINMGLFHK